MPRDLVIATHNQGKVKEIAALLKDLPYKVLSLDNVEEKVEAPEETGDTYEENALIKARAIGEALGKLVVADDSGLEVEMLPDELGVKSARYAPGTDADRNQKLLDALRQETNRKAAFVCCIVLYDPETKKHKTFFGDMPGTIAEEVQGEEGFGYDPVFIPEGYDKTNALLGAKVKNKISHRAKALAELKRYLKES